MQHHPAPVDLAESNAALAELIRQERGSLHQFLLGLLRDRAAADDVLQQVFLKLVEGWPSFRLETGRSWLFTVAYHEAMDHRRRQTRLDAALAELWARPVWQARPPPAGADAEAIRREAIDAVRRALADLPAAQREVVERRMYHNQTFATIAAELGCPLGTVLTRMRLAMKVLTRLLEE
ncbi:MAG: RNA polymerase sigma factor [Planctomycetaceae bacterium]|nr:RNA polymerase sigma factor [Planctomycetaceae bacterium]